jgi:hypothetical protein
MGSDSTGCPASNSSMLPWRLCLLLVPRAYSCEASIGECCGEWRHNVHASIRVNTHATGLLRGRELGVLAEETAKRAKC